jgi:hypothetical protein
VSASPGTPVEASANALPHAGGVRLIWWRSRFLVRSYTSVEGQKGSRNPARDTPDTKHTQRTHTHVGKGYSSKLAAVSTKYRINQKCEWPVSAIDFDGCSKKSERPVGVPAARGHGGDGGAVFEATPGFRVCVFNPETRTANPYAECP